MITSEHGVACGVSRGVVSDYFRVVRLGTRRVIVMADGHTSGWDSGQTSLSVPVLDAAVAELTKPVATAYRHARSGAADVFRAGQEAFVATAEAHADDDQWGGPAVQLTLVELDGPMLRASWLARMELAVLRGAVLHRITQQGPSPAIERTTHPPAAVELAVGAGDLVTLSSRPFAGTPIDEARSQLIASRLEPGVGPEALVEALLEAWRAQSQEWQSSRTLIGDVPLQLAAVRI